MNNEEMDKIKIRRMAFTDVDAVLALNSKLIEADSQINYIDLASVALTSPLDMSLVCEIGRTIIGFILARRVYSGIPVQELCNIHAILVETDYRKHGIGRRLVNEVISHCKKEGIRRVRTLVDESNSEVKQFFESLGFRRSNFVNYDRAPD